METTEYSLPALMNRAERYCATAEHCLSDIALKLRQWGCKAEDIGTIKTHLLDAGYIDEQRYANAFVHDEVAYHYWGRQKIRAALYAKHIEDSVVDQALQTIDPDAYQTALNRALSQKKSATREQQIRFLLQRGFTYEEISVI